MIEGDTHHRCSAVGGTTNNHVGDVAPEVPEVRPYPTDTTRLILVAHEEEVVRERDFDGVAIHADQHGSLTLHVCARDRPSSAIDDPGHSDGRLVVGDLFLAFLDHGHSTFHCHQGCVHVRHRNVTGCTEGSLEDCKCKRFHGFIGELALRDHGQLSGKSLRENREECAQLLGQLDEGPAGQRNVRAEVEVHCAQHKLTCKCVGDRFGNRYPCLVLCLDRAGSQVRRDGDLRDIEQGALRGGLGIEHINSGTPDLAAADRFGEIFLADNASARNIDDPNTIPHLRDRCRVDQVLGFRRPRQVDREHVGNCEHLIECQHLDPEPFRTFDRHIWVVGHDPHSEGRGALRDKCSDLPETEHTKGLAV